MDSSQHKQVITAIVIIKALISLQGKERHDDCNDRKKKCRCTSIYRTKAGLDIVATLTAALACRK